MFQTNQVEGTKEWWEKQYNTSDHYLYGKNPSDFLVENISWLKKGATLDVAMGEGRNAVYLAQKGFEVTAIDFSDTAFNRAQKLSQETGVSVDFKKLDLGFFLVPLMKYSTINLCDFKAPLTTLKNLSRGLEPGGILCLEAFLMDEITQNHSTKLQVFECYKSNEVLEYVKDLQILFYSELPMYNDHKKVRMIAKKNMKLG